MIGIIGLLILFIALKILLKSYMTEKRQFTFVDKLVFTFGGFFALLIAGIMLNDKFVIVMGFPFMIHGILLVMPGYLKIWEQFAGMLDNYLGRLR